MPEVATKTCSRCGGEKPVSDFYRDRSKADGLRGMCKVCVNASNNLWKANNPEKYLASRLAYAARNAGAIGDRGDMLWRPDGTSYYNADIVAEWVEPAVAPAAAESQPDFKVGDRVVLVKDGLSTVGAVGMQGVIRDYAPDSFDDYPYQVELDAGGRYESHAARSDGYRWTWAGADCLAPVLALPVGSKVTLTAHVIAAGSDPGTTIVGIGDDYRGTFPAASLSLAA